MPAVSGKVNPDLLKERSNCTFNVEEFAVWWNGGPEKLKEKREIGKFTPETDLIHSCCDLRCAVKVLQRPKLISSAF